MYILPISPKLYQLVVYYRYVTIKFDDEKNDLMTMIDVTRRVMRTLYVTSFDNLTTALASLDYEYDDNDEDLPPTAASLR